MMRNKKLLIPTAGASPRADFLPPATRLVREENRSRRRLIQSLVLVLVSCVITFAIAEALRIQANSELSAELAKTDDLLSQQAQYSDIVAQTTRSNELLAIHRVVRASEINMPSLIAQIQASIPAGSALTSLGITGLSSLESAPTPVAVTGETSAAVVSVSLETQNLTDIESFLLSARQWPGYSSSTVDGISTVTSGKKADLTIYLNQAAIDPQAWDRVSMRKMGPVAQ